MEWWKIIVQLLAVEKSGAQTSRSASIHIVLLFSSIARIILLCSSTGHMTVDEHSRTIRRKAEREI